MRIRAIVATAVMGTLLVGRDLPASRRTET